MKLSFMRTQLDTLGVGLKKSTSKKRKVKNMLITIGISILAIIGVLLLLKNDSVVMLTSVLMMVITASICGLGSLVNFIDTDKAYQDALYEKQFLEYRLSHIGDNIVGSKMIYNDIVEFNTKLRDNKDKANSLFYGWFYNKKVATIEYIEIDMKE